MQLGLSFLNRYEDAALLMLRVGLGALVCYRGYPLFTGGPEGWTALGEAMAVVGFTSGPLFWGFMGAISQFFGGMFVVVGLGTRVCSVLIAIAMAVAALNHLATGDGLDAASHALTLMTVFLAMTILGPGAYSIDARLG